MYEGRYASPVLQRGRNDREWSFLPTCRYFENAGEEVEGGHRRMARVGKLLRHRDVILALALTLGLVAPVAAHLGRVIALPVLAIVMTVSTAGVPNSVLRSPREVLRPALVGILMNYGFLSLFLLGATSLLIRDEAFRTGFVLLAAMPPAVAVIPFAASLGGNPVLSLMGTVAGYLAALALTPLIAVFFLGPVDLPREGLLWATLQLIAIPLVLSRILLMTGLSRRLEPFRGPITNWGFFIVTYTVVALNRGIFLREPQVIAPVAIVAAASMFLLGYGVEWVADQSSMGSQAMVSLVLLSTLKNCGLAAGLALAFFTEEAAVPATVSVVFMIPFVAWLGRRWRSLKPALP
jgi:BASS family bile acid:Na+ symporter